METLDLLAEVIKDPETALFVVSSAAAANMSSSSYPDTVVNSKLLEIIYCAIFHTAGIPNSTTADLRQ